jgi:hypothetical protein
MNGGVPFGGRLSAGLQALASYTWSHSIDDGSDAVGENVEKGRLSELHGQRLLQGIIDYARRAVGLFLSEPQNRVQKISAGLDQLISSVRAAWR